MKKTKLFVVLLSAAMLAACSGNGAETSTETTFAETSTETTFTETSKETTSTETSAETTTSEAAVEPAENEYVSVSPDNEFVDFEFIENYKGTDDIGDLADKAVEFLLTTEEYADAMSKIEDIDEEFGEPYIVDGKIVPQFEMAYPDDYDGDGKTETFIMLKMPMRGTYNLLHSFFIFADSSGNMTLLDHIGGAYDTLFLNYGKYKQITFGGSGTMGAEDHTILFGVEDGKVKKLYGGRVSFFKFNCFLTTFGWQGSGDFMYFDTTCNEYRSITGTSMTVDEIKAMDKDLTLKKYYDWYDENGYVIFVFIGGKYYNAALGPMDLGAVYTYENGRFILGDANARRSLGDYGLKLVVDIDIDKALAEMKKPKEPYAQVSPDNEFIDFEFIEDYKGTTDIGDLADKAVEFLKESEFYSKSMEKISEFTDEEFAPYIEDGVIVPKFNTAYPEDYDGDGKTETFIVIKMPYSPPYLRDGFVTVRDFIIFADKDGNMKIIDETSNMYPAVLLNYGKFKQIAIGGDGSAGVEAHTILYGVKDGKVEKLYGDRCYFAKEDCFLSVFGWQSRRDFMYFDTAAQEYRAIAGVDVSVEDIRAMDTANVLAEVLDYDENFLDIQLIGGKYYCIVQGYTDWGHVYTYDNGAFTLIEDSNVLTSLNLCELKEVVDIDIEQALANMKPVQK